MLLLSVSISVVVTIIIVVIVIIIIIVISVIKHCHISDKQPNSIRVHYMTSMTSF